MQFPNLSIPSLPTFDQIRPFFSDLGSKISALKASVFQNPVQTFASLDKRTIAAVTAGTCLVSLALYVLFSKASADAPERGEDPTGDPTRTDGDPTIEPPARADGEGDLVTEPTKEPTRADGGRAITYSTVTTTPAILIAYNKTATVANVIIENSREAIANIERDAFKASVLKGGVTMAVAALAYAVASGDSLLLGLALTIAFLFVGTVMHYAYNNSAVIVPV